MQLSMSAEEFRVEKVFMNKNSKSEEQYVLVTCRNKFILYSGRLEVRFASELANENDRITSAAFNKDSTFLLIGTARGSIHSFKTSDG